MLLACDWRNWKMKVLQIEWKSDIAFCTMRSLALLLWLASIQWDVFWSNLQIENVVIESISNQHFNIFSSLTCIIISNLIRQTNLPGRMVIRCPGATSCPSIHTTTSPLFVRLYVFPINIPHSTRYVLMLIKELNTRNNMMSYTFATTSFTPVPKISY